MVVLSSCLIKVSQTCGITNAWKSLPRPGPCGWNCSAWTNEPFANPSGIAGPEYHACSPSSSYCPVVLPQWQVLGWSTYNRKISAQWWQNKSFMRFPFKVLQYNSNRSTWVLKGPQEKVTTSRAAGSLRTGSASRVGTSRLTVFSGLFFSRLETG